MIATSNERCIFVKEKPYWTPDQFLASGECPYGKCTLYRLLNEGKVPSIRHGRNFIIPKAAWYRHLETCGGAKPSTASAWEDPNHAATLSRR